MNKYKEALDGAIERTSPMNNCCAFIGKCLKSGVCEFEQSDVIECEDYRCFNTLQELVERATPKKPKGYKPLGTATYYKCPICNVPIGTNGDYCRRCGQRILWGEDDE